MRCAGLPEFVNERARRTDAIRSTVSARWAGCWERCEVSCRHGPFASHRTITGALRSTLRDTAGRWLDGARSAPTTLLDAMKATGAVRQPEWFAREWRSWSRSAPQWICRRSLRLASDVAAFRRSRFARPVSKAGISAERIDVARTDVIRAAQAASLARARSISMLVSRAPARRRVCARRPSVVATGNRVEQTLRDAVRRAFRSGETASARTKSTTSRAIDAVVERIADVVGRCAARAHRCRVRDRCRVAAAPAAPTRGCRSVRIPRGR